MSPKIIVIIASSILISQFLVVKHMHKNQLSKVKYESYMEGYADAYRDHKKISQEDQTLINSLKFPVLPKYTIRRRVERKEN